MSEEEYQPSAPAAHSITCPSQLVLTGGPYTVECTIDYESNGFSITTVLFTGYDSSGSEWFSTQAGWSDRPTDTTLVASTTQTNAPRLGELTIAATLINIANDVGLEETRSNSVSTTVMVVAP